ncbi:hypothetical protein O6H91_01G089300 [Diphasiastrum complanatum]|uniref:Uncharacterized protein n=1 Tax=Diphasiastrum complanatum TaxID=34168 RepID=A0ACC2ETA3_DIPCM|nr:hypothetical protein O6H91_01G089300 [Diphasiastrum complanatum]
MYVTILFMICCCSFSPSSTYALRFSSPSSSSSSSMERSLLSSSHLHRCRASSALSSSSSCCRFPSFSHICARLTSKKTPPRTRLPTFIFIQPIKQQRQLVCRTSSGREWLEYEEAVQTSDLARALQILETLDTFESDAAVDRIEESGAGTNGAVADASEIALVENVSLSRGLELSTQQRLEVFRVLDACHRASDMNLVAKAYNALKMLDLIPNFGRYKSFASKLSPKKWGLSGNSAVVLALTLATFSYLINLGIELRPLAAATLGLGLLDAIYLGGTGLGQILNLWPPYKKRVMVHEAGHIIVAYLLGCPVRGVVLDATQAIRMGIQGQAGTQFWDGTLEEELRQGRLTNASLNRYCMVLFAGIAAEALIYGEAEGGENDENLYKAIVSQLRPPWSPAKMSNQARWAVLESYKLLKEHKRAHSAVVHALEVGESMSLIVRTIEDVMASK